MQNRKFHNRISLRLKDYDYSQSGLYFITINTRKFKHMFGRIINKKMILNEAGKMIYKWYYEIENKYPDKFCHEMIIMPNHFHCIIENAPEETPNANTILLPKCTKTVLLPQKSSTVLLPLRGQQYGPNNKKFHTTIGDAIGWFKTMTTNEYIRGVKNHNWKKFDKKLWHRNYYERIVRNKRAYIDIANYIIRNPEKWDKG
ncbi:MAG: transposase [Bacteroidota bacterium]